MDPLIRRLERHAFGHRLRGCGLGHFAEAGAHFTGADPPARDADRGGIDAPGLGCRGDQHRPRRGPGLAVLLPGIGHRGGPAGALHTQKRVGIKRGIGGREFRRHLRGIGVQFLGHQRGKAGCRALTLVEVLADHHHGVVGADMDEGRGEPFGRALCAGGDGPQCSAQNEAARGPGGEFQETPARQGRGRRGVCNHPVQHLSPP